MAHDESGERANPLEQIGPGAWREKYPRKRVRIREETVRAMTQGMGPTFTRMVREAAEKCNREPVTFWQWLRRVACWSGSHRFDGDVVVIPASPFMYGRRVSCCSYCGYPAQDTWRFRDLWPWR